MAAVGSQSTPLQLLYSAGFSRSAGAAGRSSAGFSDSSGRAAVALESPPVGSASEEVQRVFIILSIHHP